MRPAQGTWIRRSSHILYRRRRGTVYCVHIQRDAREWVLMAFESKAASLEAVLENHAHLALPPAKTFLAAKLAAEAHMRAWMRGVAALERCKCKEIGPADR